MLISLWLFLLRNFIDDFSVSKRASKEWPKYLFQILFKGRASSLLAGVPLKAPAFPPLSQVPAVTPAAEVSAGVCARPEPCSASRLKPKETKNEESSAQGQSVNFLWPEGGFWGFFFFPSSIPFAYFNPQMIPDSCSE